MLTVKVKNETGRSAGHGSAAASLPLPTVVATHQFFNGMSEPHLKILGECASRTEFDAGQLILQRGTEASRFYLIEEGEVSVELVTAASGTIYIQTIGPGEELGWSWLVPPHLWRFDARATKPTRAICFYGAWLRELCEQDAEFGYALMTRMARVLTARLQATREHLVALSQLALESQHQALRLVGKKLGKRTRQPSEKL